MQNSLASNHPIIARVFAFPRGKVRVNLGRQGLIGKICLDSSMSEDEIFSAKSLLIPALNNNYEWKAKEVANSGGSRAIYAWAQTELTFEVTQVRKSMLFGYDYYRIVRVNVVGRTVIQIPVMRRCYHLQAKYPVLP